MSYIPFETGGLWDHQLAWLREFRLRTEGLFAEQARIPSEMMVSGLYPTATAHFLQIGWTHR